MDNSNIKLQCLYFVLENYKELIPIFGAKTYLEISTELYVWMIDPEIEQKLKKALDIIDKGKKHKLYLDALSLAASGH